MNSTTNMGDSQYFYNTEWQNIENAVENTLRDINKLEVIPQSTISFQQEIDPEDIVDDVENVPEEKETTTTAYDVHGEYKNLKNLKQQLIQIKNSAKTKEIEDKLYWYHIFPTSDWPDESTWLDPEVQQKYFTVAMKALQTLKLQ